MLNKKGIRRGLGTTITYLILIGVMALIICSIIPLLYDQINDFVKVIPTVFDFIKNKAEGIFDNLNSIDYINGDAIKAQMFTMIENFGSSLTASLPALLINVLKAFFSFAGSFVIGLIIGFIYYLTLIVRMTLS